MGHSRCHSAWGQREQVGGASSRDFSVGLVYFHLFVLDLGKTSCKIGIFF